MTYKQIETSREIRQWVKLILPVIGGALYLNYQCPNLKNDVVNWFKSAFKKEETK